MSAEKYKIGDRVVVKSREWYDSNKNSMGAVLVPCGFVREMAKYCGHVLTISRVGYAGYAVDGTGFSWSDEMFEGLESEVNNTPKSIKKIDVSILPTDFITCAKLLGVNYHISTDGYMGAEFQEFQKLIICRNAYWAIADNWKPNYKDKEKKHCIVMRGNKLGGRNNDRNKQKLCIPDTRNGAEVPR